MVRLRFATYYENHPETYDISKFLEKSNDEIRSTIELKKEHKKTSQTDRFSQEKQQTNDGAYLKQSVDMKIELALMYLRRSNTHLQYL